MIYIHRNNRLKFKTILKINYFIILIAINNFRNKNIKKNIKIIDGNSI